ncbi:YeeE/YedE thiosulfate transporter family protein [Corynebacterium dentalis]|uniref:YeeE/YedE thiosulfate transporter family protein n=1 Tax=Corynebacterium dentalis TaxID=2014528 RepID=UPI0028A1D54E|nr:YeeE/YedE thiosulfate transporter family protein [Corynebacterium dentalis]
MLLTGLALGAVLGFVMQRGRFCVTGMIRDIFTQKTWRGFNALLIVIAVHAVGLAALSSAGVIDAQADTFAPLAVVIGGVIFGMGIILAGGCASGTWYRSGEGLVGSWIALFMYGVSAAAMKSGVLTGFSDAMKSWSFEATSVQASLGISVWWLAIPFAALVAGLTAYFLKQEKARPQMAQLAPKKQGLAHLLAEKPWHFYSTALIVGLLGVIAWPLSAATGRDSGLGITTPTSDTLRFLVSGDSERLNWGTLLVLGLLAGSFVAAKVSGEFRVRVPDATQSVRSVFGGLMMGVGASLAGGCTVGNGMVQTSLFGYQGWVALAFIAVGVWLGAKLWLKPAEFAVAGSEPELDDADPHGSSKVTVDFSRAPQGILDGGSGVLTAQRPVVTVDSSSSDATLASGLRVIEPGRYALDTLGAVCPFPLIEAKDAMKHLDSGEELVIDFDCTQATDAIPRWAAVDGHEVTNFEATGDAGWTISVKKG